MAVIRTGYNSLGTPCSFLLFSLAISYKGRAGEGRREDQGSTFHHCKSRTTRTHKNVLRRTPRLSLLLLMRLNLKIKIGDVLEMCPFFSLSVK